MGFIGPKEKKNHSVLFLTTKTNNNFNIKMARFGLLCIATLAMVLVTSAAPCHDKGEVSTGEPIDGLDYLDHDIGNFESDDDLGGSDDEFGADELAGGLDPSELGDDQDFGEGLIEDETPFDDFPEDGFSGPDGEFGDGGDGGEFDPDCLDGSDGGIGDHGGHDSGHGGKGLINIKTGHIGTGDIRANGIANGLLNVAGLGVDGNLNDADVA
jgi:hypothetical protein